MHSINLHIMHNDNPDHAHIKIDDDRMQARWVYFTFEDKNFSLISLVVNGVPAPEPSVIDMLEMLSPPNIQQQIVSLFGRSNSRAFYDAANSFMKEKFGDTFEPIELILPLQMSGVGPSRPTLKVRLEDNVINLSFGAR